MASAYNKFQCFVADVPNKVHNLSSDQLKLFLTNTVPVNTNTVIANITEVAYTNLSTRNLSTTSSTQTSGTYALKIADLTLTSTGGSTGPFRYVGVYNVTAASGNLISWFDYGSSITLADGESLVVDLDNSTGFLTIV